MWEKYVSDIASKPTLMEKAKEICKLTRQILCNGNVNPYPHVAATHLRMQDTCLKSVKEHLETVRGQPIQVRDSKEQQIAVAILSFYSKTGNCGEHTAIAFCLGFLHGLGVYSCQYTAGDHCFVILSSFLENNVLCDPWADKVVDLGFSGSIDFAVLHNSNHNFLSWQSQIWTHGHPPATDLTVLAKTSISNQHANRMLFDQIFHQIQPTVQVDAMDLGEVI